MSLQDPEDGLPTDLDLEYVEILGRDKDGKINHYLVHDSELYSAQEVAIYSKEETNKLFGRIIEGLQRQSQMILETAPYALALIGFAEPFWRKSTMPILRWIPAWRNYWNRKASAAMDQATMMYNLKESK